jgi:hypothetical protein
VRDMDVLRPKIAASLLMLMVMALVAVSAGCRNKYMVTDETGKVMPPNHDSCSFRSTVFERSLCEAEGDPLALEKVRICVMRALIRDLARRRGPASEPALVLKRLDSCDFTRDSSRVQELLHRGMLELDYGWIGDSVTLMDQEITNRAASILQFRCFNPNDTNHLDELGKLIALHGPCKLETWTETTLTVSFNDGTTCFLVEDEFNVRKVTLTATSYEEMIAMQSMPPRSPGSALSLDAEADTHKTLVNQRRFIDIPVDFAPLDFAGVYLHILPTDSLGRPLNAQAAGSANSRWDYRSAYLDCFVNLDEFADGHGKAPDSLILDVEYAIERCPAGGTSPVSEKLAFRQPWPQGNKGLTFRLCTRPIKCPDDDDPVDYEATVRVVNQGRTMIRKFPFRVEPASYELLVARNGGENDSAMPVCERKATARIGAPIDLLVPLVNLPGSSEQGAFCCNLDLYLIPEGEPYPGSVTVGPSYPLKDSADVPPGLAESYSRPAISPYIISSREICLAQPNAYSSQTVTIPRQYAGGGRVRRGNYLLGGYITAGGEYHSQVQMTRLTLE